jgi:hypothetical protein
MQTFLKLFTSHDDLSVKWQGRKSKKIAIVKDNDEGKLSKLLQDHTHNALLIDERGNKDSVRLQR